MEPVDPPVNTARSLVRQSALEGYLVPGVYPRHAEDNEAVELAIVEKRHLKLFQFACWPETESSFAVAIADALPKVDGMGINAGIHAECVLLRTEPMKWWLLGGLLIDLPLSIGTSLDISHSWVLLDLRGSNATELLNRHCSLDLREHCCAIGSMQSTALNHVGVKLWRHANGYALFVPRGFAVSVFQLLCESARQFGYRLTVESDGHGADTI